MQSTEFEDNWEIHENMLVGERSDDEGHRYVCILWRLTGPGKAWRHNEITLLIRHVPMSSSSSSSSSRKSSCWGLEMGEYQATTRAFDSTLGENLYATLRKRNLGLQNC